MGQEFGKNVSWSNDYSITYGDGFRLYVLDIGKNRNRKAIEENIGKRSDSSWYLFTVCYKAVKVEYGPGKDNEITLIDRENIPEKTILTQLFSSGVSGIDPRERDIDRAEVSLGIELTPDQRVYVRRNMDQVAEYIYDQIINDYDSILGQAILRLLQKAELLTADQE